MSHDLDGPEASRQISFVRAKRISALLVEELSTHDHLYREIMDEVNFTGRACFPHGGRIESVGYGSTRCLTGFDDGTSHPENRRIDVALLSEVELDARLLTDPPP